MIQEFVTQWEARKKEVEDTFRKAHPSYLGIVEAVVGILGEGYGRPDPERITEIDHGEYQGTLLYVIAAHGYQPSDYWLVKVDYGSCSQCDTLQGIRYSGDWEDLPNEEQVKEYMTLALHILQGLKAI